MPKHLRISEAAEILGVSTKALRRWSESGKLVPQRSFGGQRFYTHKQLRQFNYQPSNTDNQVDPNLESRIRNTGFPGIRHLISNIAFVLVWSTLFSTFSLGLLTTISGFKGQSLQGIATGASKILALAVNNQAPANKQLATTDHQPSVLAASSTLPGLSNYTFNVNLPSVFSETVEFEKEITAPNVVYSLQGSVGDVTLTAGDGISIDGTTITNSGLGSSQKIFKTIKLGSETFSAGSNTDTLEFVGSSGTSISIDTANKKLTFSSTAPDYSQSGWTRTGTVVGLTTTTDSVVVDGITFGNATVTNGESIIPDTDLGSDLGSSSFRFNNLWVANINSNSSQSFSGQTTFSYAPTDSTITQTSVLINPTTSAANGQLLAFALAGYQRALIDAEGDIILGYNGLTSAPVTDYPLTIYGHDATNVAYVTATGSAYLAGSLGIGTSFPDQKLTISQGNIQIDDTTFANKNGIIYKGTVPFIHNFNYGNNGTVTTDGYNTFVGKNAGNFTMGSTVDNTVFSSSNTGIGEYSLNSNTAGYHNTANGAFTLRNNTTGYFNTANGSLALNFNTTGYSNAANGAYALYLNTDGYQNVANGLQALYTNTTGYQNTANGYQALRSNTTGYQNTANGVYALYSNTNSYNTANGYEALYSNTSGSYNTASGYQALRLNTTGHNNTADGNKSLYSNTTGYYNTGGGTRALYLSTTGYQNAALGYSAGTYAGSGYTANATSNNSLYLGYDTRALADAGTNEIVIGASTIGNGSNSVTLGNTSITKTVLQGKVGIGATSPTAKLDVAGDASTSGSLVFRGTSPATIDVLNGDRLDFQTSVGGDTGLTSKMTILNNGNVGINTTSPSYKLDVSGIIRSTAGLSTFVKAGTISDTDFTETALDGLMAVDSTDNRLYVRSGGIWKYIAFTGGFQIPTDETTGLSVGDYLIPFVESGMDDGAVHGMYKKFSDVKDTLLSDIYDLIDNLTKRIASIETSFSDLANKITTKESHQEKVCVGTNDNEICLNKDQIKQIVDSLPSPTPSAQPATGEVAGESTTPTPEASPTVSPSASPSATPIPEI